MAYNDPQLLHLDSMLTGFSAGFDNPNDFIFSNLFPAINVSKQSDKYYVFNRDTWGRVVDDIREPGAFANELPPMTLSRDTYFAQEHSLEDVVPIEEQQNADSPLQPMMDATERVTNTILLVREQKMVDNASTAANYATGYTVTLSGTSQWNDYTNSDPIGDVKTGRQKIHATLFRFPNIAIAGWTTALRLEDHTKILNRIQYAQRAVTTDEIIQEVFGIQGYRRASQGKLTSVYGQAETVGYMFDKDFILAYVPDRPGRKQPSFGYEFVWPFEGGMTMPTERWFEIGRKSDVVRTSRRYAIKNITVDGSGKIMGGYLIKNAVA